MEGIFSHPKIELPPVYWGPHQKSGHRSFLNVSQTSYTPSKVPTSGNLYDIDRRIIMRLSYLQIGDILSFWFFLLQQATSMQWKICPYRRIEL